MQAFDPNVLMLGPPEAGKSRLARRLRTILLAMTLPKAIDIPHIRCIAGLTRGPAALVTPQTCHTAHHVSISGMAHHLRPP
jgi:predicted ATPase with chaperone activity